MRSGIFGADDSYLSSAGSSVFIASASPIPLDTICEGDLRTGRGLAIERFREVIRAAGGRFAEMTEEESTEIVQFLEIYERPLLQPVEGASK